MREFLPSESGILLSVSKIPVRTLLLKLKKKDFYTRPLSGTGFLYVHMTKGIIYFGAMSS